MQAVFIVYNQVIIDRVRDTLQRLGLRGYTHWEQVKGVGGQGGEPHLGSHTWPGINNAMLVMCDTDQRAKLLLQALKEVDELSPAQGLRAYTWEVATWS